MPGLWLYYSRRSIHDELLSAVDERFEMDPAFFDRVKRETPAGKSE